MADVQAAGIEILPALCMAHGRRQFVQIAPNFPDDCRYVLEKLGKVYYNDAVAREKNLSAEDRLRLHQERSGPLMDQLHSWLEAQLSEKKTEPNPGLGKAIGYLLRHWKGLTAFLRHAGAPLDNNICEQALKRAVLHRKNALFYKTLNGCRGTIARPWQGVDPPGCPAISRNAIEMLLNHRELVVQDAGNVATALALFRSKPALGFSDCLILELARKAGHLPLGTFDRSLAKVPGTQKL